MKPGARTVTGLLVAALAAGGWLLLRAGEAPPAEVHAALHEESEPETLEGAAIEVSSREPADVGAFVVAKPAEPPVPDRAEADRQAEAAVASLRGTIEALAVGNAIYGIQVQALTKELEALLGPEARSAVERIAADGSRSDIELISAATLLRELVGHDSCRLPGAALAALRRATIEGPFDSRTANLSAAALGRFGDAQDRQAMLDQILVDPTEDAHLRAIIGLNSSRGDGAVFELAAAAESSTDGRCRDVALMAIAVVVCEEDSSVSEEGRRRCLEMLRGQLDAAESKGNVPERLVMTVDALDFEAIAQRELAELVSERIDETTAQAIATRLARRAVSADGLFAIANDASVPDARRVYACEALARMKVEFPASARALLERLRDEDLKTTLGYRAGYALSIAAGDPVDR